MPKKKFIIGIDEVGRGPLAGPVFVSALIMPSGLSLKRKSLPKLRDSKRLSARQRKEWLEFIDRHAEISYVVSRVSPGVVDKKNIARAANLAATRAFLKLVDRGWVIGNRISIFLDGRLFMDSNSLMANGYNSSSLRLSEPNGLKPKTLIRGDQKINAIKLASIVAKVKRDEYMVRLHKKYPEYGFDEHKGYGTKKHLRSIKKHGPSKVHRLTFI